MCVRVFGFTRRALVNPGHGAYDRTRCGRTRASPISFATHRTQQISKTAVVNDSEAILKCILSRKQKACSCAHSTTGAAYAASGL